MLATLWARTSNAIKMADAKNLVGKVVIDVTNPWDYTERMSLRLAVGYTDSAGEIIQRILPDSKV
ncbi:MAG: hypothetical protein WA421_14400 [Nitrososphaeraceae archaeon]